MGDNVGRKRKHSEITHEGSKTVKGIFKKDDLEDSLSTSDWGLIIDESSKKRRAGYVKQQEEPLSLFCCWEGCSLEYTKYEVYCRHLEEHIDGYKLPQGETVARCFWMDCTYNPDSLNDLRQHVCFHGYHTKLKSIGKNVEQRNSLPECTQSEKFEIPTAYNGYNCEWIHCHEKFWTVEEFFIHCKNHVFHNPRGHKEGVIKCEWKGCKSSNFISQYKLNEHLRMHTKEKLVACPTCGHLFASKTKFCDHRARQLPMNRQSYLCSQCSKYFPSERLLRDHMRLHVNHYKCSMCEMTCTKPSILAKHIRYRHLKEKPYKCKECDYTCVSKHNLDIHVRKHNPEKHFNCSDCDFKCRSAYGLEKHCSKAHKKGCSNPYECHNCKKRFSRGGHLTKHLMNHHNYHWPSGHSRFRYKEDPDGLYRLQTVRYETLDVTEEIIKGKTVAAPSNTENVKVKLIKRDDTDRNKLDTFDVLLHEKELCEVEEEVEEHGLDPPSDLPDLDPLPADSEPDIEPVDEVELADEEEEEEEEDEGEEIKVADVKPVFITIDDVDAKGNVLKSKTIQSSEIICTNIEGTVLSRDGLDIDNCLQADSKANLF